MAALNPAMPFQDERSASLAEKLRQADEQVRRLTAERNALRNEMARQVRELQKRLERIA